MSWRWAVRDLLRHRVRTALSLLGVAIATALLLDMVLLSGGIERSFGRLLASAGFQLRVTPAGTLPFDTEASIDSVSALIAALEAQPGVLQVGAVLGTSAFARTSHGLVPVFVYGVTPAAQGIYRLQRGDDITAGDTGAVLIGDAVASLLHVGIHDTIPLESRLDPRLGSSRTDRIVRVRGVAHFIYDARGQPSLAAPMALAQRLAGGDEDRASMLMVRVAGDQAIDSLTERLQQRFPGVTINNISGMLVQFRLRLSYFRQMSLILGTIALVVTVLLVGTLLAITVNERIGEIAALRAIGVARRSVVTQVLAEGLLLTVIGGICGIALGSLTARWLDAILTSFPGLPAAISFFVADPRQLAVAGATLIGTGLLAGLGPAWRAASTPIAATLRSDAP